MRRRAVKGVEEEAAEVFAQGWWELGTCCLGVCVSSMRDREAQVSRTMAVIDCTRLSGGVSFRCFVRCAVAAVCIWTSLVDGTVLFAQGLGRISD